METVRLEWRIAPVVNLLSQPLQFWGTGAVGISGCRERRAAQGGDAGAEGDGGRWLTCRHAGSGRGEGGNQASTACSCRGGGRVCAVELAGVLPVLSVQYSFMASTHLAASGWHGQAQLAQRRGLRILSFPRTKIGLGILLVLFS